MQLLILIALMCLFSTVLPEFIRNHLKVSLFWRRTSRQVKLMQIELDAAREELDNVHSATHAGEYAKRIKIMRAERKIADVETKINSVKQKELLKQSSIDTIAYYVSKALVTVAVVSISALNRSSPVIIFDQRFSLGPLSGVLGFPTGVNNSISAPIWAFSCNLTFNLMYKFVKK